MSIRQTECPAVDENLGVFQEKVLRSVNVFQRQMTMKRLLRTQLNLTKTNTVVHYKHFIHLFKNEKPNDKSNIP